jgi:putative FmdB family regulatory protein
MDLVQYLRVTGGTGRQRVTPPPYAVWMPRYDYRCRSCGDTFEMSRPMADSAAPAACPQGHADTVKLLTTVAVTGRGSAPSAPAGGGGGGGCCGGSCGC